MYTVENIGWAPGTWDAPRPTREEVAEILRARMSWGSVAFVPHPDKSLSRQGVWIAAELAEVIEEAKVDRALAAALPVIVPVGWTP